MLKRITYDLMLECEKSGRLSVIYQAIADKQLEVDQQVVDEMIEEIGLEYDEDGELINYPTDESWQSFKEKYGGTK